MARRSSIALLLALLMAAPSIALRAQSSSPETIQFEAAITLANGQIQIKNNAEAFTHATRAISIDPNRFEGHYFAGLALFRQDHAARALPYLRDALSRAPVQQHARIREVIAQAEIADRASKKTEEAKAAENAGNYFLAASSYMEAFELAPTRVNVGQSAVRLWLVLNEPAKAARILRRLATSEDNAVSADANRQLKDWSQRLAAIAKDEIARGWNLVDQAAGPTDARLRAAIEAFIRAADATPTAGGPDSPYMGLVVAHAHGGNKEGMLRNFKVAASYGVIPETTYFDRTGVASCKFGCRRDEPLSPYLCAADVQTSLNNIYGPSAPQAARAFCATYQKRQNELAAKRAQEEERRRQEEARKRKEEAERLAKENERKARESANLGWTLLAQASADPGDPKLENAARAFLQSIAILPSVGAISSPKIDSPHMGLIVVRAAQQQKDALLAAFRDAATKGLAPDSAAYYDRTGHPCQSGCARDRVLAPYVCAADVQRALDGIFGPAGSRVARDFCTARDQRESALQAKRDERLQAFAAIRAGPANLHRTISGVSA